jgi:hypothetical protein
MNARELVDHIKSGLTKLMLDKPLRFNDQSCSNPCDFNEFIQALRSSDTIRKVTCLRPQQLLGIAEDEWVLLVKTIGTIKSIRALTVLQSRFS